MTLTDMTQFSQLLKNQMTAIESEFDLSSNGPIFKLQHPSLLKLQLNPDSVKARSSSHGYYYHAKQLENNEHPVKGFPYQVWDFLQNQQIALIEFAPIGNAVLSKTLLTTENADPRLSAWLDYALSPELWGPEGKWPRFHQKLLGLFSSCDLLIDECRPGFYPLSAKAKVLEKHGFKTDQCESGQTLILPWDFPLSALTKLELILKMEF
jgi:hypothetical protein